MAKVTQNMLIVRGSKAMAIAYTVHILDVYDHYKLHAILKQQAFERPARAGRRRRAASASPTSTIPGRTNTSASSATWSRTTS